MTCRSRFAPCLALFLLVAACEETGSVREDDAGTIGDAGPRPDRFVPDPVMFEYMPEGCGYMVSTPEVIEGSMHGDAVGAAPAPDHIHASWAGPTDTSFTVNWRTDRETLLSQILYGTDMAAVMAADGPDMASGVSLQTGHTFVFAAAFDTMGGTRLHETHVCGLTPATRYFYKVGGPGNWSAVYDVGTGPAPGTATPFRFAVTGDSRNEPTIFAAIQGRIMTDGVDFQLFSGDAVVLGVNQPEWDAFFEATDGTASVQDALARTPFMFANGNHDSLAVNYVAQFAFPQDVTPGERGQGEEWYSFDYANAHFVFLNDTATASLRDGAETEWLEADLAAVDRMRTPWVFVVHHKPAYSCSTNHGSDEELRRSWQPIFDRYRVDVVFNGHDHDYERSKPIRGFQEDGLTGQIGSQGAGGIPVAESGTIYVVAAGAGAPLYGVDPSCYHTQITESVINYVIVEIDGRTMRYTAYRMDGSLLDQFEYTK